MLIKALYILTSHQTDARKHTFTVALNAAHPLYRGHFPNNPVLPGVCSLQIIKELAQTAIGQLLRYQTLSVCKFLMAIQPDKIGDLQFTIDIKPDASGFLIVAEGTANEQIFIKLKAHLISAE